MPFTFDPQFLTAMEPMAAAMADAEPIPVGDVAARREVTEKVMAYTASLQPMPDDVTMIDFTLSTEDGAEILLRWYVKEGAPAGPAAVYLHGGGMIMGSVDLYDGPIARYVSDSGVSMLAVDYRLAPEHPHPIPVEDAYAGLRWLHEHAAELGVDPARIAVMGDSAGGGLAAGVALLARDRGGPAVARQILIYPMLDDRNTVVDPELAPFTVWTYDDNITAWNALLGEAAGGADVPVYAAPSRVTDTAGLPTTYLEAIQLDIFRDEELAYAKQLSRGGVDVEFHLRPGVPHEFETFAYDSDLGLRARADRIRVLGSL